jgi:Spy/CpxP family protein refolding chaperone
MVNNEDGAVVSPHDRTNAADAADHTEVDMKRRHIILTIAAVALLAAPTAVLAQSGPGPGQGGGSGSGWGSGFGPHGGGQGGGMLRMIPRMLRHLDLEPGRQELIQGVLENAKTLIRPLADQSREAREQFHQDHGIGDYDETAYREFFESLAVIDVKIRLVSADAVSQVWNLLNPEQQQQLEEMRENSGSRFKRRSGGRRSP